jgi:hypothetical protein
MSIKIDIETICRICHENDIIDNLIYPCKCTGNIKYVHYKCLNRWCNTSNRTECEICNYTFKKNGNIIQFYGFLNRIRENFNYTNYTILTLLFCISMMFYLVDNSFGLILAHSVNIYGGFLQNTRIYYIISYILLYIIICIHHILREIIQLNNIYIQKYIKFTFNSLFLITYIPIIIYYSVGTDYTNIGTDILFSATIYIVTLKCHIDSINNINDELEMYANYNNT